MINRNWRTRHTCTKAALGPRINQLAVSREFAAQPAFWPDEGLATLVAFEMPLEGFARSTRLTHRLINNGLQSIFGADCRYIGVGTVYGGIKAIAHKFCPVENSCFIGF